MAQTNTSPGAHPPSGVIAVAAGQNQQGSSQARNVQGAVAVTYLQVEPGTANPNRPQRS